MLLLLLDDDGEGLKAEKSWLIRLYMIELVHHCHDVVIQKSFLEIF